MSKLKNNKTLIISISITLIFIIILACIFVPRSYKKKDLMYFDTVSETFDVTFLNEKSENLDKEKFTELIQEYTDYINNLDIAVNAAIKNIETYDENQELLINIPFDEFYQYFADYNEDVIKAELYKRGYIVKGNLIVPTEKLHSQLTTYSGLMPFTAIDIEDLDSIGISSEEISRFFLATKMQDNIILKTNLIYSAGNENLGFTPQVIYILGKKDGQIVLYGEYPLRLGVFDMAFLR